MEAYVCLNITLESKGIRVSIPHSVVKALHYGAFRWGFAASVLETETYLRNDVLRKPMVLEAAKKFTISDEHVEKLAKTSVQFPTSAEDLIERFKAMRELASFFFPMKSYITQFYMHIANWSIKYRGVLELRVAMDTKFIAKFLVATDNRVSMFLDKCMKAEVPNEISPRWLNANSICESIETSEFSYALPASVESITIPEDASKKRKAEQELAKEKKVVYHNQKREN